MRHSSAVRILPSGLGRAIRSARRLARRLEPYVPLAGGALLLTAVTALGLWTSGVVRWDSTPEGEHLDRARRLCQVEAAPSRIASRAVLFEGAFAHRPASAEAAVETWVHVFRGPHRETMRTYLARAARYGPWIRPILAEHGVPEDFLYLAVIESGLNPDAYSPAHAVGPWQFVGPTAREQGLEVSWAVDERRDPRSATDAAARYLSRLHRAFGSWALAAAAYNAGPRRVGRALRRCGCDTYWELRESRYMPRETRDYVPKLIAAARLGTDPLGHGFGFVPRTQELRYRKVAVDPASRLEAVARAAGTTPERIRRLNPHLVRGLTPARRPSLVRVPHDAVGDFYRRYYRIPPDERRAGVLHVVQRRETLGRIARSYGVSVSAIREANESVHPRRLRVGQRLRVPVGTL